MSPYTVVMDKIAWLLEENKSVAAHHGLCMGSGRVPSGTWSIPTPLTAFEMFEGQAVDGRVASKGESCSPGAFVEKT